MIQVNMYPTEWDLPEQDREELMMLLGLSATESEKKGHEKRERLPKAEQARLRGIVSSVGESREAEPTVAFYGFLVPALG